MSTDAWNLSLFDDNPEPYGPKVRDRSVETPKVGKLSMARMGQGGDWLRGPDSLSIQNPAGAPPLDWWIIDG